MTRVVRCCLLAAPRARAPDRRECLRFPASVPCLSCCNGGYPSRGILRPQKAREIAASGYCQYTYSWGRWHFELPSVDAMQKCVLEYAQFKHDNNHASQARSTRGVRVPCMKDLRFRSSSVECLGPRSATHLDHSAAGLYQEARYHRTFLHDMISDAR